MSRTVGSSSGYSIRKAVITPSRIGMMAPRSRCPQPPAGCVPGEGRKAGKAFPVGPGCDVPAPNRVVTPPQATDPNTVTDRTPAVRASVLVDVAIHHVEVARFLRKPLERIPDPVAASEPTSLTNGNITVGAAIEYSEPDQLNPPRQTSESVAVCMARPAPTL